MKCLAKWTLRFESMNVNFAPLHSNGIDKLSTIVKCYAGAFKFLRSICTIEMHRTRQRKFSFGHWQLRHRRSDLLKGIAPHRCVCTEWNSTTKIIAIKFSNRVQNTKIYDLILRLFQLHKIGSKRLLYCYLCDRRWATLLADDVSTRKNIRLPIAFRCQLGWDERVSLLSAVIQFNVGNSVSILINFLPCCSANCMEWRDIRLNCGQLVCWVQFN